MRSFPASRAGLAEREVFRMMRIEALSAGLDDVPYLVGGAGPNGYGDMSPPTDRPLDEGDVLILDIGATVEGYFCDFDRNFAIGACPPTTLGLRPCTGAGG
ncbi:MAG: M24 family metallopeptidase [Geminicoccaceae bacterium]